MECPNCSFQNIPGSKRCLRCRSVLDLAAVAYVPPRARGGTARRTWRRAWQRGRAAARQGTEACRGAGARIGRGFIPTARWSSVAWSIVPGLGHAREGQFAVGLIALGAWLALLALAGANLGSALSWTFAAAALALHCTVISLLLAPTLVELGTGRRLVIGLGVYLALLLGFYGPAWQAGRHVARVLPVTGIISGPRLRNGDVLVYGGRWARPRRWARGDLVVYHVPRFRGFGVDRIVGLPGERVVCDAGRITVDGAPLPPEASPLVDPGGVPRFELALGPGEFAVLPSILPLYRQGNPRGAVVRDLLRNVSRVRERDLAGRVWWRVRPWRRFGRLE